MVALVGATQYAVDTTQDERVIATNPIECVARRAHLINLPHTLSGLSAALPHDTELCPSIRGQIFQRRRRSGKCGTSRLDTQRCCPENKHPLHPIVIQGLMLHLNYRNG